MPTNLSKRIKAAEAEGRRLEIDMEKQAYRIYISTLTPEEAKYFMAFLNKPLSECYPATWAEAALEWSTEARFFEALYQVFGYYPKAALDALSKVEAVHKLKASPEMSVTDRINQIVAYFKMLAEKEARGEAVEKIH